MKVLIVDDDVGLSSMLKKMLERKAPLAEIKLADTLVAGLNEALTWFPDVIVLDANLRDSGPFETISAIYKFAPATVLVTSGIEEDTLITSAFQAGATDFLIKGSNANVIQRIIFAYFRKIYGSK